MAAMRREFSATRTCAAEPIGSPSFHINVNDGWVVGVAGLEPARPFGQAILSRLRLPFRHTPRRANFPEANLKSQP